ncbi:MAG: hypothetical protein PHW76_09790 [Alphaproteobacteria bacterium]|nr:hypothetical protein [Alphaproteobacteria bacterium]
MNSSLLDLKPALRTAAKSATMRHTSLAGNNTMNHARKNSQPNDENKIFDDFEALTALVKNSFNKAVQKAITENDALGIPSPYSKEGKIFLRRPSKTNHTP